MKSKSVRIVSEDEVQLIPENPDPLMTPLVPPGPSHTRNVSKNDEKPFYSIQMQQEDNFFYDPNNGNPYSTTSKTQLDPSNPFKDPENKGQNTIVSEPMDYVDDATRITKELEDVEEKQFEQEERDLSGTANTTSSSTPAASVRGDENDSDREFNWDDDPDQVKPKRRKTARERFTAVMKTPCCWNYLSPLLKRIIIAILGSCMFIIIAVVIYLTLPEPTESEKLDPNFKNIRSNVQCWMYWAAFMWHIYWGTTFILDIVPSTVSLFSKMFHGRRSERVKSYMEYYMSLKGYFCLIVLAAWNLGSWEFLINYPFDSIKLHSYSTVISKVFGCLLAASGLFFIQKAIIQRIAIKFHRTAYRDRLQENKRSLGFLDTLSKSEKKSRPVSSNPGISNRNLRKRRSISKNGPPDSNLASSSSHDEKPNSGNRKPRPMTLTDDATEQASTFNLFKKSIANIVLADKPTTTTGRVDKNKMDINSDDYAKKVARKLFYSLAYPEGYHGHEEEDRKYLDIFSFRPYFSEHDQATEAFKIFDKDGNGNVSRREFRDTVIQIYRERKSLAQSIRDTSQALGKIDTILLVISSLITVVICLSIFKVDFWTALIPFGTLLAAITFVFDSSARSLFSGILFQFVTHPYDSGDLVKIDDNYMTVENIGILGTVFVAGDGTQQYIPTTVLLTKVICNIRRSGNMGESLVFNIDFRTENDLILVLRERLLEWVQSQSRDFGPGFDLRVKDILDMNQVILNAWLPHKGNWVELDKRFQRKTRFLLALKSILTELDIKYELPAQRITSSSGYNPFQATDQQLQAQAQAQAQAQTQVQSREI